MKNERTEAGFILKHETGKYLKLPIVNAGWDWDAYFTDDPVQANRFFARELAEKAIENSKRLLNEGKFRWGAEWAMHQLISECTVKEIKVHIEFEVEE